MSTIEEIRRLVVGLCGWLAILLSVFFYLTYRTGLRHGREEARTQMVNEFQGFVSGPAKAIIQRCEEVRDGKYECKPLP